MLDKLVEMSNRYGRMDGYVLAGGGNTSYKDEKTLFVKGSGVSLANITAKDFVAMDRGKLDNMMKKTYPDDDKSREAESLKDMLKARLPGDTDRRPSVESPLHNLFPYSYVLHLHPTLVSGLVCAVNGEAEARRLLGNNFVWVPLSRPGYALSSLCKSKMDEYKREYGEYPKVLLLQNHGIFAAADSIDEIDSIMKRVMDSLQCSVKRQPNAGEVPYDNQKTEDLKQKINALYSQDMLVDFVVSEDILGFLQNPSSFVPLSSAFSPDHIVYCKARFLYVENVDEMSQLFELFVRDNGYLPKVICVQGVGAFVTGATESELLNTRLLFEDAVKVAIYTESFGGYLHMTDDLIDFILNWESEAYRQKVAGETQP